jgi:hypothetical protein
VGSSDAPPSQGGAESRSLQHHSSGTGASAINPSLEAALRRQDQSLHKGSAVGEKLQLLNAIIGILQKRGEDEPFGLRSMEVVKLRSYLVYLDGK